MFLALAVESRYDLHAGSMSSRWIYCVGPPVQRLDEVAAAVEVALHALPHGRCPGFCVAAHKGPVPYLSTWASGARRPVRDGMAGLELWALSCTWDGSNTSAAFSIVVMDQE